MQNLMNVQNLTTSSDNGIDSQRLLIMVNETRKQYGEKPIRNNDFVEKIKDELEGEHYEISVVQKTNNTESEIIHMTLKQALRVAARESKAVRRSLIDKLEQLAASKSQAITTVPALPENYISALEALLESKKSEAALALVNKEQEAELHDLKSLFKEGMTPTQFCKMLNGVNTQKVNHWLADRNWLYNESQSGTRWRATSYARDRYLTEHQHLISVHGADDFIKHQPVLLRKGAERLYVLYRRGKVPMKLNWNGDFTHQKHVSLAS
ncbi:phage antirepressor KilAC domain-containing protein [Symbiopectobacterium sp. RP]|uniref:phage antirepressor KilAC domain-containing protein n=1 Tax=Symbiopectobacterium sp. RP TaxID=3248553 RepID=UPI003D298D8D